LTGIPPAPRGVPQIEVTFDIDANGIVNVSAKDKATAKEQRITISGAGTLDKNEVERMVHEAEQHAAEDAQIREKAEAKNGADQIVYQTERLLKDLGDKVPAEEKGHIESAIANVKSAVEADDVSRIKSATEELQQASYKLSEILYRQAESGPSANGASGDGFHPGEAPEGAEQTGRPADDVIDAEFKSE
jgi:molecular chaperone DnaK